jgi:hypothetical protein
VVAIVRRDVLEDEAIAWATGRMVDRIDDDIVCSVVPSIDARFKYE